MITTLSASSPATTPEVPGCERPVYLLGAVAALTALTALLLGGVGTSIVSRPGASVVEMVQLARSEPGVVLLGALGLALVSLSDMFTVPALHLALRQDGPILVLVATGTALVGDLLGVLGRLSQAASVPAALSLTGSRSEQVSTTLDILDVTLNTAGFVLVSGSFTCFGLLMLRGFSRPLGWVAIAAGLLTGLGQLPSAQPLFYLANAAFIAWYLGLARTLRRRAAGASVAGHGGRSAQSSGGAPSARGRREGVTVCGAARSAYEAKSVEGGGCR